MELEIQHDAVARRFWAFAGERQARLDYVQVGERVLDLRRTFVPPEQRGRGIGRRIVEHALDYAQAHGYQVIPSCGFVRSFIAEHPRYRTLVAT